MTEEIAGGKEDLELIEDSSLSPGLEEDAVLVGTFDEPVLVKESHRSVEKKAEPKEEPVTPKPEEKTGDEDDEREKFIPRQRFDKVIEEKKALEARVAALEEIEKLAKEFYGDDPDSLKKFNADYAPLVKQIHTQGGVTELKRRIEENERQKSLGPLKEQVESEIDDLIERGLIDPSLRERTIKSELASRERETESERKSREKEINDYEQALKDAVAEFKESFPHADEVAIRYAIENEKDVLAVAKESHERVERLLSEKSKPSTEPAPEPDKPKPPTPMAPGGNSQPAKVETPKMPKPGTPEFDSWLEKVQRDAASKII